MSNDSPGKARRIPFRFDRPRRQSAISWTSWAPREAKPGIGPRRREHDPGASGDSGQRHVGQREASRELLTSHGGSEGTHRACGSQKPGHWLRGQGTETRPLCSHMTLAKSFIPLWGPRVPQLQNTQGALYTHHMVHEEWGPIGALGGTCSTQRQKGPGPSQSCPDPPEGPGSPCHPGLRPLPV